MKINSKRPGSTHSTTSEVSFQNKPKITGIVKLSSKKENNSTSPLVTADQAKIFTLVSSVVLSQVKKFDTKKILQKIPEDTAQEMNPARVFDRKSLAFKTDLRDEKYTPPRPETTLKTSEGENYTQNERM